MNQLAAILGYSMPIPQAPVTRSHRIGVFGDSYKRDPLRDAELEQRKKINRVKRDRSKLNASEQRILMIVKCNDGVTGVDVAAKVKCTANHASMKLTALFRRGLIKRDKINKNGTRWYVYYRKEEV